MEAIKKFIKDDDGMELTEYAMVGGLLLLLVVAVFGFWGGELNRIFQAIVTMLEGAGSTTTG